MVLFRVYVDKIVIKIHNTDAIPVHVIGHIYEKNIKFWFFFLHHIEQSVELFDCFRY